MDSARGPETTGNNPDNVDTRPGRSTLEQTDPAPGFTIGISAGQSYRTSSPVTVRPISIRWISDVPSKIMKILAVRAVYAGQRPAALVVSARIQHAPTELNVGFGSARVRFRSWYERTPRRLVSLATASLAYSAAGPSEVYFRVDLQVSRCRPGHRFGQRRGRAARGPDAHGTPPNPGLADVAPTRRRNGPDRPWRVRADGSRPASQPS